MYRIAELKIHQRQVGGFITFWKSSAVFAPTLEYLPSSLTFSSDCIANGSSSLIPFEYILLSRFRTKSQMYFGRDSLRDSYIEFFFSSNFRGLKTLEISQVKRYPEISGDLGVMENVLLFSQEAR